MSVVDDNVSVLRVVLSVAWDDVGYVGQLASHVFSQCNLESRFQKIRSWGEFCQSRARGYGFAIWECEAVA